MVHKDVAEQKKLSADQLRRAIDTGQFDFGTTDDVEPLKGTIGQERALQAIGTGLEMTANGFNVFAAGRVGTGRNSTVRALVERRAVERQTPGDRCYVHNFETPDEPNALELPAGMGRELEQDMERFLEACQTEIPGAFQEESYEQRKDEILQKFRERRNRALEELSEKAQELDHSVEVTPAGIAAVPVVDGEPLSQDQFSELNEEQQEDLREKGEQLQELVQEVLRKVRQFQHEAKEKTKELDSEVALFAVEPMIKDLMEKYSDSPEVQDFLQQVQQDIVENVGLFKSAGQDEQQGEHQPQAQMLAGARRMALQQALTRYHVNVVVDNACTEGAPIIDERNPTFYNLFGMIEYRAQFGGMTTDFTMLRAGAFQRANGGYLILQAMDVLRNPFAWDGLKRAIRTGQVTIENMWERYHPTPAATLEPEPMPCQVKVILIGSSLIYHLLYTLDPDFRRLFKIKADFDIDMKLDREHLQRYAAFVRSQCDQGELPAFDREATVRVIEHGMRVAGHRGRLTTEFLYVADLIAEAGQLAGNHGEGVVSADHVQQAIDAQRYRSRKLQDRIQRLIEEGAILIDTEGAEPGQVNGLSVYDLGDYVFGNPSRITCVTSVGRSGVVNIERESKMSGSIHDKGVLIMTGYLSRLFGQDKPLSLSAHLAFEQTYGGVEGDSASCAELYALLSSLADLPLRQDIAVTGSVNQRGQVQPIGGVNEKIEGFFEVCRQHGLTGEQGVVIPARNAQNLMLNQQVVQAVGDGEFHVWAVETVEEGIKILTGMPAGERQEDGAFPDDTVFGRADRRLREMADVLKAFGPPAPGEGQGSRDQEE